MKINGKKLMKTIISCFHKFSQTVTNFFYFKAKLAYPNWHRGESNMRPWGEAHTKVPSQHHQANLSGISLTKLMLVD